MFLKIRSIVLVLVVLAGFAAVGGFKAAPVEAACEIHTGTHVGGGFSLSSPGDFVLTAGTKWIGIITSSNPAQEVGVQIGDVTGGNFNWQEPVFGIGSVSTGGVIPADGTYRFIFIHPAPFSSTTAFWQLGIGDCDPALTLPPGVFNMEAANGATVFQMEENPADFNIYGACVGSNCQYIGGFNALDIAETLLANGEFSSISVSPAESPWEVVLHYLGLAADGSGRIVLQMNIYDQNGDLVSDDVLLLIDLETGVVELTRH